MNTVSQFHVLENMAKMENMAKIEQARSNLMIESEV